MNNVIDLGNLSHRTRERVRDLGEVFTPESYVENMLSLLDKNIWKDESVVFFEPTCGHGNIVLTIFKKRLENLFNKATKLEYKNPAFFAVANAINSLWAIDIDSKNIENCKTRVMFCALEFLKSKNKYQSDLLLIKKNKDFFAHMLCALNWQIHENEALSGLSEVNDAKLKSDLTRTSSEWFKNNTHKELDFDSPWCFYYTESLKDKIVPIEYARAEKFINNLLNDNCKGFKEFSFASYLTSKNKIVFEV